MKTEAELAAKDPEADLKELTTHVYVDNAHRNYNFTQITSEESFTKNLSSHLDRNIEILILC